VLDLFLRLLYDGDVVQYGRGFSAALPSLFFMSYTKMGVKMAKVLKTSIEGRKCAYPLCKQTLSVYNHGTYCHIHQSLAPQAEKTKILAPHHT
jgi:hypothetical protein